MSYSFLDSDGYENEFEEEDVFCDNEDCYVLEYCNC